MSFCWVYITCTSRKQAREISSLVVGAKLAACANMFPIDSVYRWKGKVQSSKEVAVVFKTRRSLVARISTVIRREHSYDCPCIVALPFVGGSSQFLKWIKEQTV